MTCKSCNPSATAGPAPYYEQVSREVTQDHQSVFASLCYAAGIVVPESWVIPEDGSTTAVSLTNVTYIPVGAYLYNPQYGYFKISQWNPKTNAAGLTNESVTGTAPPGTSVPADSIFIVVAKPCCEDDTSTLFPFLAQDFVAPPALQNLTIEVTSTFGLRLGDLVRIGTGVYRLNTILSSRQVVIYNEGAGIAPGDTVSALSNNGEYQYLIVSENASACSAPDVLEARLIVCDGNLEKILRGRIAGQVPVLQDSVNDTVKFQLLDAGVRTCSELVATFNVIAGVLSYTIAVDGTTGFLVNDIIQVNFNSLRFIITAIGTNSLTISATPAAPGASQTIPVGAFVCKTLTSEVLFQALSGAGAGLQNQITALSGTVTTLSTAVSSNNDGSIARDNAEISARTAADGVLSAAIAAEAVSRANADSAEAAARLAADNSIVTNYTNADTGLGLDIAAINTLRANYRLIQNSTAATGVSPANINVNGNTMQGNDAVLVVQNTSLSQNMVVFCNITSNCNASWNTSGTTRSTRTFELATEARVGAIGTTSFSAFDRNPQHIDCAEYTINGVFRCDGAQSLQRSVILVAGQEVRFRGRGVVGLTDIGAANQLECAAITTYIDVIGIAL